MTRTMPFNVGRNTMRLLATITILALTLNCFGQYQYDQTKISRQTEQIVVKIEKVNQLMSSAAYYEGCRPAQYNNFTDLQKTATKDELLELLNHPNGVVRSYSFWALSYDTTANLLPIIIKHLNDTASVTTQFGCLRSRERAGDFFIDVVTPEYVDLNSKKLTAAEYEYLDSILVYTPNELSARERAISRAKLTEHFYTRAKELVLKENNQSALSTIAKYRREQDIPLILNNKIGNKPDDGFFFTYKAIAEFPHHAFLPLLKKKLQETLDDTHYDTEWRELYNAIASYKNDTAFRLLQVPFSQVKHKDIREYHIEYVFGAVQKFYSSIYDTIFWRMWEHEKLINSNVFSLLYPKNPNKAFQLTKKTIQNADDFYYLSTGTNTDDEGANVNLLDLMLDTVLFRDRDYAVDLINKNIRDINVHQFPTFANKALKIKDTSFITSLFVRLEKEDNPHIYLKATEVLIGFNDKNINRRIVEVSKRNVNLRKGWGGQDFARILKENNIR